MTYAVQDTTVPSPPAGLKATLSKTSKQIQLTWSAASDNVGVAGYRVFRNSAVVGTATTTGWIDTTIASKATYTYWVVGYDAAGNVSAASNSVTVTLGGTRK